jgi:hypothetical protein
MKDEDCGESCDLSSLERELEAQLDGPDESARFTPLNDFFILHNTCTITHNKKYLAPSVLALAERLEENKRLCREIADDEASKKTSLTRLQKLRLLH